MPHGPLVSPLVATRRGMTNVHGAATVRDPLFIHFNKIEGAVCKQLRHSSCRQRSGRCAGRHVVAESMDDVLTAFLVQHVAREEEPIDWGDMPLRLASYLTTELPPLRYITSVRAVVDHNAVLVFHDGNKHHILPGGRSEPGESLEATLHREVLEETGYTLRIAKMLGFMHFQHLGPKPDSYGYPYPDFLQLVFVAQPGEYLPDRMIEDMYVRCSGMFPLRDAISLRLDASERLYLAVALEQRAWREPPD